MFVCNGEPFYGAPSFDWNNKTCCEPVKNPACQNLFEDKRHNREKGPRSDSNTTVPKSIPNLNPVVKTQRIEDPCMEEKSKIMKS